MTSAIAFEQDTWQEQADDPIIRIDGRVDPDREDAHWQSAFRAESYHRQGLGYDDYAPAYCVGYIGYAQYGGRFDDAEKSLIANWIRIKGDSQLELDEAIQAIRAAWDHAEVGERETLDAEDLVSAEFIASQGPASRQQPAYAAA